MPLWNHTVDVIREAMFAYAHISNGNVAYGIIAVTFLARLAMLPLTIKLARAAAVQQAAMQRIEPELEALRAKFKTDLAETGGGDAANCHA